MLIIKTENFSYYFLFILIFIAIFGFVNIACAENLPLYETQAGTIFEDFETIGDWALVCGTGAGAIDATDFKTGAGSLKLTTSAGGNCHGTKTVSLDPAKSSGALGLWVYTPDVTKIGSVYLYFSLSDWSKYFTSKNIGATLVNGWNFITLYQSDWTATSGAAWTDTMTRFRARVYSATDQVATVYFDSLYYGFSSKPKAIFTFDDGNTSDLTIAQPALDEYGFKGTSFIVSTSGMSGSNLQTLYDAGWDLSNHTHDHINLTTLATQAEIEEQINDGADYLKDSGFTRAADYLAYPNAAYNDTVLAAVAAQNVIAARIGGDANNDIAIGGLSNKFLLKSWNIGSAKTLVSLKSNIDTAITNGQTIIFLFHGLVESDPNSAQWTTADFEDLETCIV